MSNLLVAWLSVLSLIIGPFVVGCVFEGKISRENRELGSPLRRH
jgi:hypothetical protein